jgi:hypothetical protein
MDLGATVEVDEHGWPALISCVDEPRHDGELWQQLVASRPGLAGFRALVTADVASLSTDECADALLVIERHRAWLDAVQQEVLAAVSRGNGTRQQWSTELVSVLLGIASQTARSKVKNAKQLVDRLPDAHRALRAGELSVLKAVAITEASYPLPDEALDAYQDRVLKRASGQNLKQLKDTVKRAVIRLDPTGVEGRRIRAVSDRCVRVQDAGDGMAWLTALLPAQQAMACYARIDAAATLVANGDDRTKDQRRADLLVDGVLSGLSGELPTSQGLRPTINVTVSLQTLARVTEEPGWLDGYGPITAEHARELAADVTGTWRRMILDPIFQTVIDYGTTRYRPPKPLADLVIARHGTCVFPTCDRPADKSDLDHTEPFPHGHTSVRNLCPLCRRHHRLKHETDWTYRHNDDGTTTWTAPDGRSFTNHPPPRWPSTGDPESLNQ